MSSPRFSLDKYDWQKIGQGALVALAGAAIVFLTQTVEGIDFGKWTPLIAALSSIAVNALWKFIREKQNNG